MKAVKAPTKIVSAQSMSADFATSPISVIGADIIGLQINYTDVAATGSLSVQASLDYNPVSGSGNWASLYLTVNGTSSNSIALPAATTPIFVDIYATSAPYLRISYTRTSGAGTADIYLTSKRLGD